MGSWRIDTDQGVFIVWAGKDWHALHLVKMAGMTAKDGPVGVGEAGRQTLLDKGAKNLYGDDAHRNVLFDYDTVSWRDPHHLGGKKHIGTLLRRLPGGSYQIMRSDGELVRERTIAKVT